MHINAAQRKKLRDSQQGFTIVELMIAMSILAVLLVTSTLVLIQIGALYSKGVNAADLQNATRTVVSDVSGQLQFSGKIPLGCKPTATTCYASKHDYHNSLDNTTETVYSYCISNTRYSYVLDRELGTDSSVTAGHPNTTITPHVLWRDTITSTGTTCPTMEISQSDPETGSCYDLDPTDPRESPVLVPCSTTPGSGYEMLGNHMRLVRFKIDKVPGPKSVYGIQVWTAFGDSDLVQSDAAGQPTCSGGPGTQFCSTSIITTQLTGRIY